MLGEIGTRTISGWLFGDQVLTAATVLSADVMRSSGFRGCQAICVTAFSWSRIDAKLGLVCIDQIQTILGRCWSIVARNMPSELNAIVEAPRWDAWISAVVVPSVL